MKKFKVKFTYNRAVYLNEVYTDTSENAMRWVKALFPESTNVTVEADE